MRAELQLSLPALYQPEVPAEMFLPVSYCIYNATIVIHINSNIEVINDISILEN